jgi:hypothetical protein
MKTRHQLAVGLLLLSTLVSQLSTAFAQGSLTPPGAPAPTMKSLDQVEPRTPVDAAHTPGDGSNEFIISKAGSYCFTTNIVGVSGKYGIQIAANNVTLDLKGFALLGTSASLTGINIPLGYTNITVHNGTISGWSNGGYYGVFCFGRNATLEGLTICGNEYGAFISDASVIKVCTVNDNYRGGIIDGGSGSAILDNICAGNNIVNGGGLAGITVSGSNNRIEGNHLTGNGPTGDGIFVPGSVNTNNLIVRNFVVGNGANNYSSSVPQIIGPLITNTASGFITNSNPWANFSY